MKEPFKLEGAKICSDPFAFFYKADAFDETVAIDLLDWFESSGSPWESTVTDFYEQHEFRLDKVGLPESLQSVCSRITLDQLRRQVGAMFDATLTGKVEVTAHRLTRGQRIRIHNDFIEAQESHRLLLQINRGWAESDGGLLLIFDGHDPESVYGAFCPVHRLAFGFAISPDSYHAVSRVNSGERFTLVYSFYEAT